MGRPLRPDRANRACWGLQMSILPHFAARAVLAGAAIAGAWLSAPAQAAVQTYNINVACPGCGPGPSFGTVTVTEIAGNDLSVLVQLASGITFHRNQNANHHALAFGLVGNPTVTISGLSDARFSASGSQGAHAVEAPPFSPGAANFEYEINYEAGVNRSPSSPLSTLSFQIGGATPLSIASLESHAVTCGKCVPIGLQQIYFAIDISNARGLSVLTGNVGATISSGVPEPSTWAMMLIGFAGLALASRRRQAAA